jgi:putative transposase
MARRPRVFAPGLLYHVIVRGNQRQKTFSDKRDYQAYLERLSRYRKKFAVTVYAYCLMPNHVHLLVEGAREPLSKFMQGLQQTYTQYFNRRYKKVGHLFQGRYHAIVCEKDQYLSALVRCIHLNPVRATLVQKPEQWLYTGHAEYCGSKGGGIIDSRLVLNMLGGKKAYQRFVRGGMEEGHKDEYYEVEDQRFLGSKGFAEELTKQLIKEEEFRRKRKPLSRTLSVLAEKLGVDAETLRGADRSWKISRARAVVGYVLVRRLGYGLVEVARCLLAWRFLPSDEYPHPSALAISTSKNSTSPCLSPARLSRIGFC